MKNSSAKKIMQGALILSLASIVAKVLSAVYRIPLQNLVGNTGFYVYQQVYPIYGIGMTFALSGFPTFISKMIAEEPDEPQKQLISRYSIVILTVLSITIFLILMMGAHFIALAMGDGELAPLIRVVSTMFLLMPLLATGRGYYQGVYNVIPTAKSQVIEQIVRVAIIIGVAMTAAKLDWSVYKMGTWAMTSSTVAAIIATLFFTKFGIQLFSKAKFKMDWQLLKKIGRRFIGEGGVICLLAAMVILLQLVDSFTVKNSLVASGASEGTAKALKGIYDRAQPLVQLGTVIATSFATTLLPSLTEALQRRDTRAFYQSTTSLFRVALTISMAASIGMIALMPYINKLLFGSYDGALTLAIYNLSVIFAGLIFVCNSVLQSTGAIQTTFKAVVVGIIVKIIFNGWAVRLLGTLGASIVTVLSLAIIAFVMNRALPKQLPKRIYGDQNFLIKLILGNLIMFVVVGMTGLGLGTVFQLNHRWGILLIVLISVLIGVITFSIFTFRVQLFSVKEWLTIPYGSKILRIMQRNKK